MDENESCSDNSICSDEGDDFSTATIDCIQVNNIPDELNTQEVAYSAFINANSASSNTPNSTEIYDENDLNQNYENENEEDLQSSIPRNKSIAHNYMASGSLVYCSFDSETGGEDCEVLQISAEIFRINGMDGEREEEMNCFNEYVRSHDNAIWNDRGCEASHGLHNNHPSIAAADKIESVWPRFHSYVSSHIGNNQKGVLIALGIIMLSGGRVHVIEQELRKDALI